MNSQQDTHSQLLAAARELFARRGFAGSSVRAITEAAHANLGAVTYHFGSKEALYEAACASLADPLAEAIVAAAAAPGSPLDRIERVVRTFFGYLFAHPQLPRIVAHQLASDRPIPEAAKRTLQSNHGTLATLIAEGQRDGTIRAGDPRLMALSIGSQPIWLGLVRRALQQAVAIDQADPDTWRAMVESAVAFVRAGLARHSEETP